MDATLFDFAADRLEHHAGLDRLEARGTLRIALKAAGLVPKTLTGDQLQAVFEKIMPGELDSRGVSNMQDVCGNVLADLANAADTAPDAPSPDEIFRRLADG